MRESFGEKKLYTTVETAESKKDASEDSTEKALGKGVSTQFRNFLVASKVEISYLKDKN